MEVKWLLDFLSLVDTQNFSRSAEARATTQPAFSRRIRALEDWLGATLFDRSEQPIQLTQAGQTFRPVAEEVLRRLLQIREEIQQIGKHAESTISFTSTHSLSLAFFPRWILQIEAEMGILRTRLESNQIDHCVQTLMHGECQFLISPTHSAVKIQLPEDRFTSKTIGHDRLLPVSAAAPDGAPLHLLIPGSLKAVEYLAYDSTAASGRAVEFMLRHHDSPPALEKVFDSHLAGVLKPMAVQGRGLAWLPESEIIREIEQGKLVVAGDASFVIPSEIKLFRNRDPLPRAAEEFWRRLGDADTASS